VEKQGHQQLLKHKRYLTKSASKDFEKQQKLFKSELKAKLRTKSFAEGLTKKQYKAHKKELYKQHGIESTSKWRKMKNSAAKGIRNRVGYLHRNLTTLRTGSEFDLYKCTGFYLANNAYSKITE
jgi:hypothetical protein